MCVCVCACFVCLALGFHVLHASLLNSPEDNYSKEAGQHQHCVNVGVGNNLQ